MTDIKETSNIDSNDINYDIITKNKKDILENVYFDSEEDMLLCDSIITNLEKTAAKGIRNLKVVNFPFIGCVRINMVKRKVRDNFNNFKLAKKHMTSDEYKEYAKEFVNYTKETQKEKDNEKLKLTSIRQHNKRKYEDYYKTLGKAYADAFIYSIYLIEELPFDEEWEEQYQRLKNLE